MTLPELLEKLSNTSRYPAPEWMDELVEAAKSLRSTSAPRNDYGWPHGDTRRDYLKPKDTAASQAPGVGDAPASHESPAGLEVSPAAAAVSAHSESATTPEDDVRAELRRALAKFPTWPTDPFHALAVVLEELGELAKAMLHVTYEPGKSTLDDVRSEAIQTSAMAERLRASLGRYRYTPCEQHEQHGNEPSPNKEPHDA